MSNYFVLYLYTYIDIQLAVLALSSLRQLVIRSASLSPSSLFPAVQTLQTWDSNEKTLKLKKKNLPTSFKLEEDGNSAKDNSAPFHSILPRFLPSFEKKKTDGREVSE